ncbi:MAG: Asp-tRNA(Asn)/Glu-tRNA(Gln) amidotransferase subunit GatA [Candidatus Komeilibacteria bacterium]|nr:Asp-tRNA(Asn)/Glu-tRNA(Gln) amidotransferase subunit GatA [Candidatus Komeilibacteria bacterium]
MSFKYLTISQVKAGLKSKEFSCVELVNYYLEQINRQRDLNTFITVMSDSALAQAKEVDQKISDRGPLGELEGVPIAIKDLILTKGVKTTASSKILADYIAPYDATVVSRLKEAGTIILGKNNCDEFAMGSSNETSAFGLVLNPWDKTRVPGGSSGGSAAAVAADQCVLAIGTDTGGSTRQPASLCGVVGLKPTYGRVSRYGLIAMTSSLDQAGPITRSVEDSALVLKIMAGQDNYDATASVKPVENYLAALSQNIKGLKVGLPKEYFTEGISPEVSEAVKQAIKKIEALGAEVVEVSLPHTAYALAVYYIILPAEVSSNLARFDGIRYGFRSSVAQNLSEIYQKTKAEGFGAEVKRRMMIGTYVLSAGYQEAYYVKAKKVQNLIRQEYAEVFKKVDLLVTPTCPTTAFKLGEKTSDPLTMYLNDVFTVSANIAGLCGISIPAGFDRNNLPIGLQILGAPFAESQMLRLAYNYQEATEWHKQHPL